MRTQAQREERIRRWCGLKGCETVHRTRYTDECGNPVVRTTVGNIGTNYRHRSFLWFKWLEPI